MPAPKNRKRDPELRHDPAYVIMDLHDRLREAHAENLGLRERIVALGEDDPGASLGVITLTRIRALENVLDLARIHVQALPEEYRKTDTAHALFSACIDAGRAP
jgi:hypothetical protein